MNPFRFAIGAICALALALAWIGPSQEETPSAAPTPIQSPTVAIQPTPPTVTTTSTSIVTTTTVPAPTTTTFPWALIAADHVCEEWGPMMLEEGWPADREILETALGIMYRESRCQPDADSGPDHGLFQINRFWSSDRSNPPNWLAAQGIAQTHDELFDPRTNIRAALAIYNYSCERNGLDRCFAPWTTWSGN
jgi:hypothetical protein